MGALEDATMPERGEAPTSEGRRRALVSLGGLAAVAMFGRCGTPAPKEPPAVRASVPLASLPEGARTVVRVGAQPVEVRRENGEVLARSLLCTHFGCTVRWEADRDEYHCPCHDGRFDRHGKPVQGPPPRPLAEVPVRIEGDAAVVG
jgi:cytochrome b6-f complex iron-sulfur subunit